MDSIIFVHLFHILFVGGLFLYVGIVRNNIPIFLYNFLLILGVFIIIYHSYKVFIKLKDGKNPWINYFHVILVAPLIIYIGINREKTERYYFELLLMLAFADIGYHTYYLIYS
jgi:hypothetical protein